MAEIVAMVILAIVFHCLRLSNELPKAIITVGFFVVVIPTAFRCMLREKEGWDASTIGGFVVFHGSYLFLIYDYISIITWLILVVFSLWMLSVLRPAVIEEKNNDETARKKSGEEEKDHISQIGYD